MVLSYWKSNHNCHKRHNYLTNSFNPHTDIHHTKKMKMDRPASYQSSANFESSFQEDKFQEDKSRHVAIIADEDTCACFILTGIGCRVGYKNESTWLVVDKQTDVSKIQKTFKDFTTRSNIAIILITQDCANRIRADLIEYKEIIPTVLEIPSRGAEYNPKDDHLFQNALSHLYG